MKLNIVESLSCWIYFTKYENDFSAQKSFLMEDKEPFIVHIDGLVQDCSISSALAMEKLQSCTKQYEYVYSYRLEAWWCKELGHQQPCYWSTPPVIIWFPVLEGLTQ